MNIHEHQAKQILKKYGAVVPEGVVAFSVEELVEKAKSLKTEKFVLKAQIHAGGRGKAGGVKILIIFSQLSSDISSIISNLVVTILSGLFFAIFSISIPPWSLEIKAIFELPLSTKHEI